MAHEDSNTERRVLTVPEHIRQSPGMYIGNVRPRPVLLGCHPQRRAEQARGGLTAVVSVRGETATWDGATRLYLNNRELRPAIESTVGRYLKTYFQDHPDVAESVIRAAARR